MGVALACHKVYPPPFNIDAEPSWLVDDYFVASADEWESAGKELLHEIERAAREAGAERLIVLTARRDEPKRHLLEAEGYERGASWWVHAVTPSGGTPPALLTIEAIVGRAPPVYDPGERRASRSRSTIRPRSRRSTGGSRRRELSWASSRSGARDRTSNACSKEIGYEPASDWMIKQLR